MKSINLHESYHKKGIDKSGFDKFANNQCFGVFKRTNRYNLRGRGNQRSSIPRMDRHTSKFPEHRCTDAGCTCRCRHILGNRARLERRDAISPTPEARCTSVCKAFYHLQFASNTIEDFVLIKSRVFSRFQPKYGDDHLVSILKFTSYQGKMTFPQTFFTKRYD